jgi:tetratricopeptide (TPR) repeat protein
LPRRTSRAAAANARPTTGELARPAGGSLPQAAARGAFRGPAVGIFAVALAVRLVHLWQIRRAPFFTVLLGDSRAYDEWAQRLAGGDWIGHDVFYQAPLYPYFLGLLYAIGGRHLLLVRVVQAVLGSAACVLLGLAARGLLSNRAGLAAGLILALYAPAIFFDGLIQKSVLDVFFVSLALCLIARIITVRLKPDTTDTGAAAGPQADAPDIGTPRRTNRRQHTGRVRLPAFARLRRGSPEREARRRQPDEPAGGVRHWLTLGLAIGGLSLTRENAVLFTAVVAVWACWRARWAAATFLAGVAIVILPVAIRNSHVGGGFYVTTSQFGPNFYIGNNPQSDGSYQSLRFGRGAPEYERQDATEIAERALRRKLTPAEVSGYWTDRALDFIASSPGAWLALVARKAALLVNATEMLDTESQESHAEWSVILRLTSVVGHFGVLVPLAALGMIVTWPDRTHLSIVYAMLAAYAGSVILFYVFARYRYPLVPFLVLFAAAAITRAGEAGRAGRARWARGVRGDGADGTAMTGWTGTARRTQGTLAALAGVAVLSNWPLVSSTMNRAVTEQNVGAALQSDGRLDEAMAHYRRAIELRPDYAPAYNNLASTLRAAGQVQDAVSAYEHALTLRRDYPEAHYNLANALLDEGHSAAAIEHFQMALTAMPDSADVHNNLGIALSATGRLDEASAEFRNALEIDPDSVKAHRNLGDALLRLGSRVDGLDHLRRAAQLAPTDGAIHYDLGSALLEAGELDEGVPALRAAVRLVPDSVEAHNNLGIALGSQGKLDEAIAEFQQALKLKPDFVDAQRNLTLALITKRR